MSQLTFDTVLQESRPSLASRPLRFVLGNLARRCGVAPIIASSGRAGSTMLFDSVPGAMLPLQVLKQSKRAKICITETAWDLQRRAFRKGIVYKSHDYPPQRSLPKYTRVIYTFSDPTEVVFSLLKQDKAMGRAWIHEHYNHIINDWWFDGFRNCRCPRREFRCYNIKDLDYRRSHCNGKTELPIAKGKSGFYRARACHERNKLRSGEYFLIYR